MSTVIGYNPDEDGVDIAQLPQRYNIKVYQGDGLEFVLNFAGDLAPMDVTDWTGIAVVKSASEALLGSGVVSILGSPAEGNMLVNFDDATDVPAGEHKYDVQISDSSGRARTVIAGKFTVVEDVSE